MNQNRMMALICMRTSHNLLSPFFSFLRLRKKKNEATVLRDGLHSRDVQGENLVIF